MFEIGDTVMLLTCEGSDNHSDIGKKCTIIEDVTMTWKRSAYKVKCASGNIWLVWEEHLGEINIIELREGDKVVCINDSGVRGIIKDKIYRVTGLPKDTHGNTFVTVLDESINLSGVVDYGLYDKERFELYKEIYIQPFKYIKKVRKLIV